MKPRPSIRPSRRPCRWRTAAGGNSLRVRYLRGVVGTGGAAQFLCPIPKAEEWRSEYRVRFGEGFDFVKGGKLPGLCGGRCTTGGERPTGDGWSARFIWRRGGRMVLYLYHLDQPGPYGQDFQLGRVFTPGTWHTPAQRVRMNTPGRADGLIEVWVDGEPTLSLNSLRLRTKPSVGVDRFYFSTFFGGNDPGWAPRREETVHFDGFRVFRR